MQHLLWIGSIILELSLQARTNLVVLLLSDIITLKACCALSVNESASSNIIILCLPSGKINFWVEKDLILSLTVSIVLSSEAFNSKTAILTLSPNNSLAIAKTDFFSGTVSEYTKSVQGTWEEVDYSKWKDVNYEI